MDNAIPPSDQEAWDRFAAAAMSCETVDAKYAAELADELLTERAKRFPLATVPVHVLTCARCRAKSGGNPDMATTVREASAVGWSIGNGIFYCPSCKRPAPVPTAVSHMLDAED